MIARALLLTAMLTTAAAAQERADMVVINGKIFTADAQHRVVEGFAVKDGRFLAVGTRAAMQAHVGAGTKLIDLKGGFVTPGLADGHLHSEGGGPGIDLSHTR